MDLEDPMNERVAGSASTRSGRMKKFGSGFESILTSTELVSDIATHQSLR